jgi:phosphate transport system permease protein
MALVTPTADDRTRAAVRNRLTRRDRNLLGNAFLGLVLIALLGSLLTLFSLLARVITEAFPAITSRGASFLSDTLASSPDRAGIWPGLYGSIFIGLGVVVFAIPLGVGAAVYLEEYARPNRWTQLVQVNIRNLAGVPSVIYGVLGLTIFVGWLRPVTSGSTVIAAALTVATLVMPIVIITASEAIRAVPQGLRDAGYGVGASRWEVTRDHVLPYAAPGILTGTVLSLARALGEAAPLIVVGAITGFLPQTSLTDRFTALPMLIYSWSGRADEPGAELSWGNSAAAAGLVLLLLVLAFNTVAIVLRIRFERRRTGT